MKFGVKVSFWVLNLVFSQAVFVNFNKTACSASALLHATSNVVGVGGLLRGKGALLLR